MVTQVVWWLALLALLAGGGYCASKAPPARCHWQPRHADTLTERINGRWICKQERNR
jgi:hypothetical protein